MMDVIFRHSCSNSSSLMKVFRAWVWIWKQFKLSSFSINDSNIQYVFAHSWQGLSLLISTIHFIQRFITFYLSLTGVWRSTNVFTCSIVSMIWYNLKKIWNGFICCFVYFLFVFVFFIAFYFVCLFIVLNNTFLFFPIEETKWKPLLLKNQSYITQDNRGYK